MRKTRVYLADLRHNYGGVLSTDCMPLGVGFMKAVMDKELPQDEFDVRIFAYPDRVFQEMESAPPDVLMVTNYVWNEAVGLFFARYAKQLNPSALVVMGGPNIPVESERQIEFVAERPELDVYICGEGDFAACDLVKLFDESGMSLAALGDREIPSSVYRRPGGELVRAETADRRSAVNDIPSPWLTGVMDQFFDGKLAPIIETNRGCPFRCTFCVQGTSFYTRVNYFDLERLEAEIEYVAELNNERSPHMGTLRIADPNFGMYERDVEIAGFIGNMQKKFGWPTFIDATTGKNKPDRIIEAMEKVNGALVLYQAVQSLDEEVLRNIDRSNIKLDAYEKIMGHVRGRGLRSNSDLILGLPGETLDSHLKGLYALIDAGTDQAHCFQAMMLKGSELETIETRDRFEFDTRFRVLPKNYGIYGGEKVFDIEEIIVATESLSFEDYIECRKHHLSFSVFWNDSWFNHPVAVAETFGIKASEWLQRVLQAIEAGEGVMGEFLDDFVAETIGELFPTPDACADFYLQEDNFERLRRGEIGDNLMYKYRAKASFLVWQSVCACATDTTRTMLQERGATEKIEDFDALWSDFHTFVEASHASGVDADELVGAVTARLSYDVGSWLKDGAPHDVSPYRFAAPRDVEFRLSEEGVEELRAAIKVWTSHLTGLSKLVTRIRVTSQVRHARVLPGRFPLGASAVPAGASPAA